MRCIRQSGQGASLSAYSKNHAPASVARLSPKAAIAAAAAGSALARSIQPCLIERDVVIAAFAPLLAMLIAADCGNLPVRRADARASAGEVEWRPMDGTNTRLYRDVSWRVMLSASRLASRIVSGVGWPGSCA